MRVRSQKRKEVRMYDQNTGEFIPEAETRPTTVNPQETQIQQNQPQPQYPNNQQVSVINNIQQTKSNGIGTAGFVFALISFLFCWAPGVNWVIWFLGAIFSIIGCFKEPRGLAIAGTIISFIDIIVLISIIGAIAGTASAFLH